MATNKNLKHLPFKSARVRGDLTYSHFHIEVTPRAKTSAEDEWQKEFIAQAIAEKLERTRREI